MAGWNEETISESPPGGKLTRVRATKAYEGGLTAEGRIDRQTRFNTLGFCIKCLAELHDIHAMLTQGRADRR